MPNLNKNECRKMRRQQFVYTTKNRLVTVTVRALNRNDALESALKKLRERFQERHLSPEPTIEDLVLLPRKEASSLYR